MSLYQKYRPKDFDEIYGNMGSIGALTSMLKNNPPHAFLFYGPKGCGKTTLAKIVASKLESNGMDFHEMDSADFRGIDTIREIKRQCYYAPNQGSKSRTWMLDEVHKLTNDAQNSLLKLLESPPDHVYFILCTTDPNKLLPTVKYRCTQFKVQPLVEQQTKKLLLSILKKERKQLDDDVLEEIHETSKGHPRSAIQILDLVLHAKKEDQLKIARQSTDEEDAAVIKLCRALFQKTSWIQIATLLNEARSLEPESIRLAIRGYCASILIKQTSNRAAMIMEELKDPLYTDGFNTLVLACYSIIEGGE
ncbi:MAG: AAA family ATPase [Lutibacter sp.]|jgi:DNA polymerase-3 subunit gamma/tau